MDVNGEFLAVNVRIKAAVTTHIQNFHQAHPKILKNVFNYITITANASIPKHTTATLK